jgi:hypothetical protein
MRHGILAALLLWIPRVLAILLALLLAMFAMDVFLEGGGYLQTMQGFVIHLIPAACVLVILVIGWRRDGLASVGFLILGLSYFIVVRGWRNLPGSLVLTLPPLGISLAFWARMRLLNRSGSEAE